MIARDAPDCNRQGGVGLVEVMVGVTVALLAVLAIHAVFAATEVARRDQLASGDALQSGMFVLARLALDIGNAGGGYLANANVLGTCPPVADVRTTLRPIVAVITDSGRDEIPDSLVVRHGAATGSAAAVPLAQAAAAGSDFVVAAVDGFAAGERVVAVSRRGDCAAAEVTAVDDATPGVLRLAHPPVAADFPLSTWLVDLGPAPHVQTLRFDVASGVLRTTDVAGGDAPVPLASNIVNLKFQYGVDADGDGALDTWVPARDAGELGTWTPAAVLAAPVDTLRRIKAIRVGLIVRSDFPERAIRASFPWVLFDCPAPDKTACPGRLEGTISQPASGGYRFRVFETVVPLRNQTWRRS